jgi:hypothetical protein
MLILYYKIYEAAKRVVEAELKSQASCNSVQPLALPVSGCVASKTALVHTHGLEKNTTRTCTEIAAIPSFRDKHCLRCQRKLSTHPTTASLHNAPPKSPDQLSEPCNTPLLHRRYDLIAQSKHTTSLPMIDSDVDTQSIHETNNNRSDQVDHCRSLESNHTIGIVVRSDLSIRPEVNASNKSRAFANEVTFESRLSRTLGSVEQQNGSQLLQLRFHSLCNKCSQSAKIVSEEVGSKQDQESTLAVKPTCPDRITLKDNELDVRTGCVSPTLSTNANRRLHSSLRERKASITLGVIMCAFICCWLPFFILALLRPFVSERIPDWASSVSLWLGYVNSMLNPIIYVTFHQDFRRAFKYILLCRCKAMKSSMRKEAYHVQYG